MSQRLQREEPAEIHRRIRCGPRRRSRDGCARPAAPRARRTPRSSGPRAGAGRSIRRRGSAAPRGSRPRSVLGWRHAERNDADARAGDAEVPHDFVARERRIGEHDRPRAAPTIPSASAGARLREAEPLRVRGKRHIVHRQRRPDSGRAGARCSRAQTARRADRRRARAAASTVPSACRPRRAARATAARNGAGTRAACVRVQPPVVAAGISGERPHSRQQLRQIAADARRTARQLARVDRDLHGSRRACAVTAAR